MHRGRGVCRGGRLSRRNTGVFHPVPLSGEFPIVKGSFVNFPSLLRQREILQTPPCDNRLPLFHHPSSAAKHRVHPICAKPCPDAQNCPVPCVSRHFSPIGHNLSICFRVGRAKTWRCFHPNPLSLFPRTQRGFAIFPHRLRPRATFSCPTPDWVSLSLVFRPSTPSSLA